MNRGSPLCLIVYVQVFQASMRPRFMNRGSSRAVLSGGRPQRCFNEAPIHESGKYDKTTKRDNFRLLLQ